MDVEAILKEFVRSRTTLLQRAIGGKELQKDQVYKLLSGQIEGNPNIGSIFTAYASLRLQKKNSENQEKLEKTNFRLQIFLGAFVVISAIGTLVQALIAAHVIA